MTELINLTQAKQHLRYPLDVDADDDALYQKLELAHGLVLDFCKAYVSDDAAAVAAWYATVDAWTSDTAPAGVRAAILETLSDLDADRGDRNAPAEGQRYHTLPPRAAGFLVRIKDPVLR
ncbi:MAG TPA: hypothetical protein VFO31_20405 [Vicinamibacterales bacterium]|nr:hypothetical protein [Vicinamibacterales bacterium]